MKRKILPLFLCFYLLAINLQAQTKSPKRGFGGDVQDLADAQASAKFGWYYNWGITPNPSVQSNVQNYLNYVPMRWGAGYDKQALVNYLTAHPEVDYILGFNEPNFIEQANLTPTQAAALWPEIEEIADQFNLKIVGPAVNYCYAGGAVIENGVEYIDPVKYLDDFLAACTNCRIDVISVHGYFDHPAALPWYIDQFRKYNKPIWLTEFNHSASWTSSESQQQYMVDALAYLEKEPIVERYAWFVSRSPQANTNLFEVNQTGILTDLGLIYANMSSYDGAFYHNITQPIQAEHYRDMSGIHLIKTQDASGLLAAHNFDNGDWLDYQVDVPATGAYRLDFRVTSIQTSSVSVYAGSTLLGTLPIPNTNGFESWQTVSLPVNLNAGKQKLRLVTHSGGWKLNWWNINTTAPAGCVAPAWNSQTSYATGATVSYNNRQWQAIKPSINKQPGSGGGKAYWKDLGLCGSAARKETTSQETGKVGSGLFLYPNPANGNTVYLETNGEEYTLTILDIQGKVVISKKVNPGEEQLNIASLKAGTYLVKAVYSAGTTTKKLVIQR